MFVNILAPPAPKAVVGSFINFDAVMTAEKDLEALVGKRQREKVEESKGGKKDKKSDKKS